MRTPPAGVDRHFAGVPVDLDAPRDRAAVVGRLLEDGDRSDLAWLASEFAAEEVASWFDRYAARRLSRRSRAFWAAVLHRPPPPTPPLAAALWPLA